MGEIKSFAIPGDIRFGWGSLSYLGNVRSNRALIVTGKHAMQKFGYLDIAKNFLTKNGAKVLIIDGIEEDPSIDTITKNSKRVADFSPDWVIGMGGCSAIDAAKALWICYEYPNLKSEEIFVPFGIPPLVKAKFIAIPSTSGTGTEMSNAAVITDHEKNTKRSIVSPEILPDLVILDPELTITMPKYTTACTGMDALVHAIEAYVSTDHSKFTDSAAIEAISLIIEYLPIAYEMPNDHTARENMHYASSLAGFAQSNAVLGICHSMAHQLGGMFGITHGLANAILLPHIIRYNAEATDRYETLAQKTGNGNANELIKLTNNLARRLELGSTLKSSGILKEEYQIKMDQMVEWAIKDDCTLTNPRKPSPADIKTLFTLAYE